MKLFLYQTVCEADPKTLTFWKPHILHINKREKNNYEIIALKINHTVSFINAYKMKENGYLHKRQFLNDELKKEKN
jgi:hypothetical protein